MNGSNIFGTHSSTLLLTNLTNANLGNYSVVVTSGANSVTSQVASVVIDSDGDGLPDSWEMQYFGDISETASGDADGDEIST